MIKTMISPCYLDSKDEKYSDLHSCGGGSAQSTIDRLVDQMPHRIVAVVDSNGSQIKW